MDERPEQHTSGWVVARVGGAPVILTPSFLLVAAVLMVPGVTLVAGVRSPDWPRVVAVVVGLALTLLVAVLVHELAHGAVARARGLRVHEYAVTFWGGHTRHSGGGGAATTALVAAAGPAANLALGGLAWLAMRPDWPGAHGLSRVLLLTVAGTNLAIGAFNLVPGLPLDGGQLLAAAVWGATGDRRRGERVAAWAGRLVAVGLAVAVLAPGLLGLSPGLLGLSPSGTLWGLLIAWVIWQGAGRALRGSRAASDVDALTVAAVGTPAVGVPVDTDLSVLDRVPAGHAVVGLAADGRPVAVGVAGAAGAVPADRRAGTPLHAVAQVLPDGVTIDAGLTGRDLLEAVARVSRVSPVAVALAHGRTVALVTTADVAAAVRR